MNTNEQVITEPTSRDLSAKPKLTQTPNHKGNVTNSIPVSRKNNKTLRSIFSQNDAVYFSMDMIKNEFIQISPTCEKVFGYSSEEFTKNPDLWPKCTYPEDMHLLSGEFEKLSKGETVLCENRIYHRDKSVRWIERRIEPFLNEHGKLIKAYGVARDITKARKMEAVKEAQLHQPEKKTSLKEKLFQSLSTKMRISLNSASHVSPHFSESASQNTFNGWSTAIAEGFNGTEITSKITRQQALKREKIQFSRIVDDVRTMLNDQIRITQTRINTDFKEVDEVYSMKAEVQRLFYNIIQNCIEFKQSRIPAKIEVKTYELPNSIKIVFQDNGIPVDLGSTNTDGLFAFKNREKEQRENRRIGLNEIIRQAGILGGKTNVRKMSTGTEFSIEFEI
jgi:PAS domain S-box-containing protein